MSELFHRFYRDRVKRNLRKETATQNLFDFSDLLQQYEVPHFLVFGTLLGAVRDHDFIEHDTDVDLGAFAENLHEVNLLCRSTLLASYGFKILRQGKDIISVVRDEEHIDLYLWTIDEPEYTCAQYRIPSDQLKSGFGKIAFLGRNFATVRDPESDLAWRYGSDWRTPRRGYHAQF